jgi:hydroxymethylglutaryl-CoA reductase
MGLHARNIAIQAGATMDEADAVAKELVNRKKVRMDVAEDILKELRAKKGKK